MVKKPFPHGKSAFTMIELIFAIVIIAISVISLPMMSQVTSKGIESNLVQEAIFAASAELNQVLSYQWDENAMDGNDTLAKIVCPSGSTRVGLINQPLHRRCIENNASTILGSDSGDLDDIDDAIRTTPETIFLGVVGTKEGYKQDYNSDVNVIYTDFGDQTIATPTTEASQNMKKITVRISDDEGTVTLLKAYSANIGEIDYYKRSYQ